MRDTPAGYSVITPAGGRQIEHDIEPCAHCRMTLFMKTSRGTEIMVMRADGTHYFKEARRCSTCWQLVCLKEVCNKDCVPFEKALDLEETAARKLICS